MEKDIRKSFAGAKYEPEPELAAGIWRAIKLRDKRNARIKFWSLLSLGTLSLAGAVPTVMATLNSLAGSGFYQYFSLAFSNSQTVLSHWGEFSMSLLESLPVTSLAFSLLLIFIFFLAARQAGKQIEGAALSF